jgi:hypothetical protein
MHWRWFLPLPLAAFLCGEAVRAPQLKPELPPHGSCAAYERARDQYLLAYGYTTERPDRARELVSSAMLLINECPGPAAEKLRARGNELSLKLKKSL